MSRKYKVPLYFKQWYRKNKKKNGKVIDEREKIIDEIKALTQFGKVERIPALRDANRGYIIPEAEHYALKRIIPCL